MTPLLLVFYLGFFYLFHYALVAIFFQIILALYGLNILFKVDPCRVQAIKRQAPLDVRLAVIVPVHNEAKNLVNLFQSLGKTPAQVIVVNDASTDGTAEILARLQPIYAFTYITVTKQQLVCDVLNCGLSLVHPEVDYVGVINGDCTVDSSWFENVQAFLAHYAVDGMNMANKARPNGTLAGFLARLEKQFKWYIFEFQEASFNNGYFVQKKYLEKKGWETITEDLDLTLRVKAHGGTIYQSNITVYDTIPGDLRQLIKQKYRWVYGDMAQRMRYTPRNAFDLLVNLYYIFPAFTLLSVLIFKQNYVLHVQCIILIVESGLCMAATGRVGQALCYPLLQFTFQLYFYVRLLYTYIFKSTTQPTWL